MKEQQSHAKQIMLQCLLINDYLTTIRKSIMTDGEDIDGFVDHYSDLIEMTISINWEIHNATELMNTSIHIPKEIRDRLNTYLKHHKIPKNKLIVKAIEEFLEKEEQSRSRHEDIFNWQGVPGVEFDLELDRDFLLSSREEDDTGNSED